MKKLILNKLKYAMLLTAVLFPIHSADADTFVSNSTRLDFEVRGSGAPVFVLHGGLASREDLRQLINQLAATNTVVALDSREHGNSENSPLQISYSLMANDVSNLADHLKLNKITIVGQSDGGITALATTIEYPELVARLVLLGTNFNHAAIPESSKEYLRTFKAPREFNRSQFPGMYLDEYLSGGRKIEDFQQYFDELAAMWVNSPDYTTTDLAGIKVPVLVINGDHEDIPLDHTLELYQALPDAQLFIVPGATHFLQRETPKLLHQAILNFLAR